MYVYTGMFDKRPSVGASLDANHQTSIELHGDRKTAKDRTSENLLQGVYGVGLGDRIDLRLNDRGINDVDLVESDDGSDEDVSKFFQLYFPSSIYKLYFINCAIILFAVWKVKISLEKDYLFTGI